MKLKTKTIRLNQIELVFLASILEATVEELKNSKDPALLEAMSSILKKVEKIL